MLPDHALHASSAVAAHHARAGGNCMEVARREWRGALLRSAGARCRTGQRSADDELIHASARNQIGKQQFFYVSGRADHLHQCRDLEAQSGSDHRQQRRSSKRWGARRTSPGCRSSAGLISGWQVGIWISRARQRIRLVGSRARCAHTGADRCRYARQTRDGQRAGDLLRAASFDTESTAIIVAAGVAAFPRFFKLCRTPAASRRLPHDLQYEQRVSVCLQGSTFSW